MKLDAVLTEIRAVREAYAEKFSGDVASMLADLQKRQQQGGREVATRLPKRLEPKKMRMSLPNSK